MSHPPHPPAELVDTLDAPPVPHTRPWLAVTLGALIAVGPLAIDMYLPAFPRITADLGLPEGRVELTLSVFLLGMALGQLVAGPLSDRIGRRAPMVGGALIYTAASVACVMATTFPALLAARFVMGLGGAAGMVVVRAVVRDLFTEREAARMFSLMMLVMAAAPVLAPSLGSALLEAFNWHVIFWVMAGFGLFCAVLVVVDLPETLPPARRVHGHVGDVARRYADIGRNPRFLAYVSVLGLISGLMFAYISGSAFVFMEHFGLSAATFSVMFSANAVGLFALAQLNRALLRRWSTRRVLAVACCINALIALLLFAVAITGVGGLGLFYALTFCCVSSLGLVFPNATAAAMDPFPHHAGSASALLGMIQFTLGAAAGATVSALHDGTALPMTGIIAACSLAAAGCSIVAMRTPARSA